MITASGKLPKHRFVASVLDCAITLHGDANGSSGHDAWYSNVKPPEVCE